MQCLLCGKEMGSDSLYDLLFSGDVICSACRRKWVRDRKKYAFQGYTAVSLYVYENNFRTCLLQFKERNDEALAPVFLADSKGFVKRYCFGYTVCLLPSSQLHRERRGFDHLEEMWDGMGVKTISPFMNLEDGSQKGKGYTERQKMSRNIIMKENVKLPKKIVLFDDVITTGATMRGALQALDRGHQVKILSAGHTLKKKCGDAV